MFSFIVSVLFVSFVCAASEYSERYVGGYPNHYPTGVSHVSRLDLHDNKHLIPAYEPPLGLGLTQSTGQYGYRNPLGYNYGYANPYGYNQGYPAAHSYSNRIDIHASTPVLTNPYGHGYAGYGYHDGNGYGYAVHGYGVHGLHHGY